MTRRDSDTAGWTALSFLLFALLTVGSATAAYSAGVAMVTDLQGKAAMLGAGKSREVTILTELAAGTQIQLDAGAVMVALYLETGDEYVFKGPAQIVFRLTQPDAISGPKPEKLGPAPGRGGKRIRVNPVDIAQGAMVLRGARSAARIRLLSLFGTGTLDVQPEFRWQEVQPGLTYQFEISDDTGRTLHEVQIAATAIKLPSGVPLIEGVAYTWTVSARLADGRKYSNAGEFSIAPASLRAQAEDLRPAATAPVSTRVSYAAWLYQMELKDEARKYWRALYTERPEDVRLKALAAE